MHVTNFSAAPLSYQNRPTIPRTMSIPSAAPALCGNASLNWLQFVGCSNFVIWKKEPPAICILGEISVVLTPSFFGSKYSVRW